jgi:hypothetical protein
MYNGIYWSNIRYNSSNATDLTVLLDLSNKINFAGNLKKNSCTAVLVA